MKKKLSLKIILIGSIVALIFVSCKENINKTNTEVAVNSSEVEKIAPKPRNELSEEFKAYWYAGEAEITSYQLQQARYGEIRDGKAVLIFVTEPFLADKQVKADDDNHENLPVLKLNSTKNYLTGIYPYSIMTSSFYPVHDEQHAIKVTFSAQEWCGHVYSQLNNRKKYQIQSQSYFEKEGDQNFELEKTTLENELWNKIRINPKSLPIGELQIIPSFEYIRLSHKELKAYDAVASLAQNGGLATYEIKYPELERTLTINFMQAFPYSIESWSDSFKSGFGDKAKMLTSTANKIQTIKSPYWTKNSNSYLSLRDSLGL